jgi:transcriptional regulator with XRE-family HTH domain
MSTKTPRKALQVRASEAHAIIRQLLDSGLTMNDIAERARVSPRSVYRWLNEGRSPHPIWLDSLRRMHGAQGNNDAHQEGQE